MFQGDSGGALTFSNTQIGLVNFVSSRGCASGEPSRLCPCLIFPELDTDKFRSLECTRRYSKFGCCPQLSEGTVITCSSIANMMNKCSHA
jgi:hypothetical protein